MNSVLPYPPEPQYKVPSGAPQGRTVPLRTLAFALVAAVVGVGAQYLPEMSTPVSLALATFLVLDRVYRQIR
ncbi:hypothetical protein [Micromonospora costi]|uniref:Uncharacterized protein n=1 Tax=Micromonospora costi TaxID=1530042 RepID=A0A3B0A5L9_9ACTN|nr:hypothetical protein [Micromonospora costi]RKN55925.1 hypothetical protein D7193_15170 [Micromonospora costi]